MFFLKPNAVSVVEQLLSVAVVKVNEVALKKLEKGEWLKVEDLGILMIASLRDIYGRIDRVVEFMNNRFAEVGDRFAEVHARIDEVSKRIGEMGKRIDEMGAELSWRISEAGGKNRRRLPGSGGSSGCGDGSGQTNAGGTRRRSPRWREPRTCCRATWRR